MRRALLSALILAGAFAIARARPIQPLLGSAALASAREVKAYRLGGAPLRFALRAGQRRLRILTNLDLPPGAEDVPYALKIRIPEEGLAQDFSLVGVSAQQSPGAPAAFYLGEAFSPARSREVAIERAGEGTATLELSLDAPAPATASVRLLAEQQRPPLGEALFARRLTPGDRARLAAALGTLDWDELGGEAQEELLSQRWARVPAAPGAATRRLYLLPTSTLRPPRPPREPGEPVEKGQVVAYTVAGPGTLRLVAPDGPLPGTCEILDGQGTRSSRPLDLPASGRVDLPITRGLATVRVRAGAASRVLAVASAASLALPGARLHPRPDGEVELAPSWIGEEVARAEPGPAMPVAFELAGRGGAELRLSARVALAPEEGAASFRVRWVMRDRRGAPVREGELAESAGPALEDRIEGEPVSVPGEPAVAYLWSPPGAVRLELSADRPVLVGMSSPGFEVASGEDGGGASLEEVRLRNAPQERPAWFHVRPGNEPELRAAGRMAHLRLAIRLEPRPPPAGKPGEAETLEPIGQPPRLTLLLPARSQAPGHGGYWSLPAGHEVRVTRGPGARGPATLVYVGPEALAGGEVSVSVDGRPGPRTPLYTSRGRLAVPVEVGGAHSLRVDAGTRARLFLDSPVSGGAPYRSFGVHALAPDEAVRIRLDKGAGARALGAVVYFDAPPGPRAALTALIDSGHRRPSPTGLSRARTRLVRSVPLVVEPAAGAVYLDRTAPGVWASAPVFIRLEDDLPPGAHEVSLTLEGTRARAFARFFAYREPPSAPSGSPPPVTRSSPP